MFDGKRLLKILQREEKSGIILIFSETEMIMLTDGWMAVTTRENLLKEYREVLGHIVEVLGYIPEAECVSILKTKGDYCIEHPLPEVIAENVSAFRVFTDCRPVQYTGLSYGGPLLQDGLGEIRRCLAVGPNPGGKPVLTDSDIVVFKDVSAGEEAYYTSFRPREDISSQRKIELWAHLESVSWNVWEPQEADGEVEGQTELEEMG